MENSLQETLVAIQTGLKVPKSQTNAFGKYKYRSCEDILEALKPLLKEHGVLLSLSDSIECISGRFYVKATAMLQDGKGIMCTVTAYAREEEDKKGMDGSQITGAASSYARKYALNGLFLIDDTKDADATNDHKSEPKKSPQADAKAIETKLNTPATEAQLRRLTELCDETGTDKAKLASEHGVINNFVSEGNAKIMIAELEKKLSDKLNNL